MTLLPTHRLTAVLQKLIEHFSDDELRTCAFVLGLDYDSLPGLGKDAKARDLLILINRKGQLDNLLGHVEHELLNVPWRELLQSAQQNDDKANAPYKGMDFFDFADADLFFGRDVLTRGLVTRSFDLSASNSPARFLAIVGASGSGKSSLARAGLAAKVLASEGPTRPNERWLLRILTPTARPIENLALEVNHIDEHVRISQSRINLRT